MTVSSPSYFSENQEPPNPGERILRAHTCRLTSQVASCVRMRTAISLLCCTARCNGEFLFSLSCTFGSKPLFSKSFKASPVLSLIKNWKKKWQVSCLVPLYYHKCQAIEAVGIISTKNKQQNLVIEQFSNDCRK